MEESTVINLDKLEELGIEITHAIKEIESRMDDLINLENQCGKDFGIDKLDASAGMDFRNELERIEIKIINSQEE